MTAHSPVVCRGAAIVFGMSRLLALCLTIALAGHLSNAATPVTAPPLGKLYHGFYYDGPATNEHDVTAADVLKYEEAVGKKTAWVFFSDNWFESRKFPAAMCAWIRGLGKVPYVRLTLRSDLDQDKAEKIFSLDNIIAGRFDEDLKRWAQDARAFGSPILIEWGTEPNGEWFFWNGKWNGGAKNGPERYV